MPEMMIRLHRALPDEVGAVDEAVRLLSADQILTSTILRVVNSTFYSLAHPVTSIHHAVSYLGFRAVVGIVTARTLDAIFVRNREAVRGGCTRVFRLAVWPGGWRSILAAMVRRPSSAVCCIPSEKP